MIRWGGRLLAALALAGCLETADDAAGGQAASASEGAAGAGEADAGTAAPEMDDGLPILDASVPIDGSPAQADASQVDGGGRDAAVVAAAPDAAAEGCDCFETGTWVIDNLAPCLFQGDGVSHLYSSVATEDGFDCGVVGPAGPMPTEDWSDNRLAVGCAGLFRLCFTIKAGSVTSPRRDDCVIVEHCMDIDYAEADVPVELPPIPAWVSEDSDCAEAFIATGGYGEMSVAGGSDRCELSGPDGGRLVFHRTYYCPPSCLDAPDRPECRECGVGHGGDF